MSHLEETDSGADLERDSPPSQLQLKLHGVIVGPVQDGDLPNGDPFHDEVRDPPRDKGRLQGHIAHRDVDGLESALAHGPKLFLELVAVPDDAPVGKIQDLRGASVVRLELEQFYVRVAIGEPQDILEVGPPEGIDALMVIPHDHQVAVP